MDKFLVALSYDQYMAVRFLLAEDIKSEKARLDRFATPGTSASSWAQQQIALLESAMHSMLVSTGEAMP